MKTRPFVALLAFALALPAAASWYWPFNFGKPDGPRLSELMEPATTNINAASDFAAEGKTAEAVEKYRAALVALDRIERENPERAASAEFATLRNKRAYVNAAIDTMLLAQARDNAKPVSVTDTTELERKIIKLRNERRAGRTTVVAEDESSEVQPVLESQVGDWMEKERAHNEVVRKKARKAKRDREVREEIAALFEEDPKSVRGRILQASEDARAGRYAVAIVQLDGVLADSPDNLSALNLKAACESSRGDGKAARKILSHAMRIAPDDYHAFYNMARLCLEADDDRDGALRYYRAGRAVGGPEDDAFEEDDDETAEDEEDEDTEEDGE